MEHQLVSLLKTESQFMSHPTELCDRCDIQFVTRFLTVNTLVFLIYNMRYISYYLCDLLYLLNRAK